MQYPTGLFYFAYSYNHKFLSKVNKGQFLFSIDLEDVRLGMPDGNGYKARVPANTEQYLKWLQKNKSKCTFFVVGNMAEAYPSLIKEIITEGHEIACHTQSHITLDKHTPESFKNDLQKNIGNLKSAGAENIKGFRAPVFSLTHKTQWAYKVLKELEFRYSSSVLPAKNPLFGCEEFGKNTKEVNGVLEIPMTLSKVGPASLPVAGGVYFRVLPWIILKKALKKMKENSPVLGYFHPYDIDTEQEKFMHPGINNSWFYNQLMYYNRKNVFDRLDLVMDMGFQIITYSNYVSKYKNQHHV